MLAELYAGALADASSRAEIESASDLEKRLSTVRPVKPFREFLKTEFVSVIAEIKRASPSKGDLALISDAAGLAVEYEASGASLISVLTEQRKFKGSLKDLADVTERVSCPVLRKDFIATEYQILEARANGADVILLIVAGLQDQSLNKLQEFAKQLGLSVLVETHSKDEFKRALDIGADFIGVNARDLTTFETDRSLFAEIVAEAPSEVILVAESAVRNVGDVEHYAESGADAVLVGEALVTGDHKALIGQFSQVPKIRL